MGGMDWIEPWFVLFGHSALFLCFLFELRVSGHLHFTNLSVLDARLQIDGDGDRSTANWQIHRLVASLCMLIDIQAGKAGSPVAICLKHVIKP
jgi:hypothetical protein